MEARVLGDRLVTALGWDGRARVLWVEATEVCRELADRHGLTGRASALASELLVANALMASWIKGDERLMLQLQGEEPPVSYLGEVWADGSVRGRLSPPEVEGEGLALRGVLLAIKSDGRQEMYRGVTEIRDEPVGRALERHLRQSEQVLARVRVDVARDLAHVQGLVIERLPRPGGAEPWEADAFDAAVAGLDRLGPGDLAAQLAAGQLLGGPLQVLERRSLIWWCTCSRERVASMLLSLGAEELGDMLQRDRQAEITCQFCNEVYHLDEAALAALLARLTPDDA